MNQPLLLLLLLALLAAPAQAQPPDGQITVYGVPGGTQATITADDDVIITAPGAELLLPLAPDVLCSLETPHYACAHRLGEPFAVAFRLSPATDSIVVRRGLAELSRWERDALPPTPPPVVYEDRAILVPINP